MKKEYMTHDEVTQLLKDGYNIRGFTSRKAPSWHKKVYYMWKSMWRRCYDPTHPRYQNYKDVIIADDFKLFSNYLKWIQSQSRFEEFCSTCNHIRFSIDKDAGGGHYFPHMMVLCTQSENTKEKNARCGYSHLHSEDVRKKTRKPIIGIHPTLPPLVFETYNDAKAHGYVVRHCLKGREDVCSKGYKWYYLNIIEL